VVSQYISRCKIYATTQGEISRGFRRHQKIIAGTTRTSEGSAPGRPDGDHEQRYSVCCSGCSAPSCWSIADRDQLPVLERSLRHHHALPAALAGIVWMLFATHTTLSVPALTGAIMCMGVATRIAYW